MLGTWYGPDFSDSRDPMIIFSDSKDPILKWKNDENFLNHGLQSNKYGTCYVATSINCFQLKNHLHLGFRFGV